MKIKNNKTGIKKDTKNLVKNIIGHVPFTAELYWLIRQQGKSLNSRFSLSKLDDNLPDLVSQVKAIRGQKPLLGKKIFIFATLHYWIEHATVTALSLSALGFDVTLGFLPYHDWQNDINKFDLRRQNLYAEKVLGKASKVIHILPLLNLHAGYKTLPPALQEKIEQVTRFDSMYTLQVEKVNEKTPIYKPQSTPPAASVGKLSGNYVA
jgi:hypothetical protein